MADRHQFDDLIDARTPAEFALDHIPGAINCPTLSNEQRVVVGTLYKQVGAFEARRVGGAMVAENLARHLREELADKPANWKPLVYCWRGGLRSGSMTHWLRLVGWDAQQLAGGYKSWRRHVIDLIAQQSPKLQLRVVLGATGSAKTRILQAMAAQGQQVLDLEGLACHKGSILGAVPGQAQPSQTAFETGIAQVFEKLDLTRPLFVEGESRKIGKLTVPEPLLQRMRASPCLEICATPQARLSYLLRDYAYLGDDRQALADKFLQLKEMHGKQIIEQWQAWALQGNLQALFASLMHDHYDPHYSKSQSKNFSGWAQRQGLLSDDLSDAGIVKLASELAQASNCAAFLPLKGA